MFLTRHISKQSQRVVNARRLKSLAGPVGETVLCILSGLQNQEANPEARQFSLDRMGVLLRSLSG